MKRFLILLLALLLSACYSFQSNSSPYKKVKTEYENMYYSSVAILAGINIIGAGTIIHNKKGDKMLVLTAAHVAAVVNDEKLLRLSLGYKRDAVKGEFGMKYMPVVVKKFSKELDLAILEGMVPEENDGPYVKVSNELPSIGDDVYLIGSPWGDPRVLNKNGNISDVVPPNDETDFGTKAWKYRISTPSFFGNSGGAVFDYKYELVGVMSSIYTIAGVVPIPGASFAISLGSIKTFL